MQNTRRGKIIGVGVAGALPVTTRMPHPTEIPCDADFTMDSSTARAGEERYSKIKVCIFAAGGKARLPGNVPGSRSLRP